MSKTDTVPVMRMIFSVAGLAASLLVLAGCGSDGGSTTATPSATIVTGPQISATQPPWKPNYTELARRARLRGIPEPGKEKFHIHQQLHIYRDGILIPVAPLIGLDVKRKVALAVHTHEDTPGVIHMEADKPFKATLGDFFAIWGVKFGGGWLGGLQASDKQPLTVYVNGKQTADPAAHTLTKDDNIVIVFGDAAGIPRTPDTTPLHDANDGKGSCAIGGKKSKKTSCLMELFNKK